MTTKLPPILVTGAHRTGTTWVGKMLSANSQTPISANHSNVWHRAGVLRACVKHWYIFITDKNESAYYRIQRTSGFRYHLFDEIKIASFLKRFFFAWDATWKFFGADG